MTAYDEDADPLVSVVTPVHNGEQYLAECIRSVLDQTYSAWEHVILDNVSTDSSNVIAQRFATDDARILVIRATDFLDIYGNHNRALCHIDPRSRYCKVLHADDLLYPECLEKMVAVAERHPSVGIVSALRSVNGEVEYRVPVPTSEEVVPGSHVVRQELLYQSWATGSPSALLVRADLIRRRPEFYDTTVWHADTDAAFRESMDHDFGFVHQALTYTRFHPAAQSSFTMRVNSLRSRDGRLLARYGRRALTPAEYRSRLRRWLLGYGLYLARERLRPERRRDYEFHDFHRREIAYTLADARDDRWLRAVLPVFRRLFLEATQPGLNRR